MEDKKSGFLLINKPSGPTSHDIIDQLRRVTGIKKIGHAGTLDPFASGLLIVAVGREATREIGKFVKLDKEYIAMLYLGATTDTYDRTGKQLEVRSKKLEVKINRVEEVLEKFIGKQEQVPPMFSAKKVGGKKLYKLARQGIEVERKPAPIEIYDIKILKYKWPLLKMKVLCSSGTYIRSLAHDIGKELDCGAYAQELERIAISGLRIDKAISAATLDQRNWVKFIYPHLFNLS